MHGMESQDDWPPAAVASAFLGMAISFLIWWWYVDGARGASEQPVRMKREAVLFHIWSYAHFPLYLGIVVTGVGVQRIVTAASKSTLTVTESIILTGAVGLVMLAMTVIGWTSAGRRRHTRASLGQSLGLTTADTWHRPDRTPLVSSRPHRPDRHGLPRTTGAFARRRVIASRGRVGGSRRLRVRRVPS
jgi:hypothetical protein